MSVVVCMWWWMHFLELGGAATAGEELRSYRGFTAAWEQGTEGAANDSWMAE